MNKITFANPEFFYLFIILPLLAAWYILRNKKLQPAMKISSLKAFVGNKQSLKVKLRHLVFILRLLAFSIIIIILARPQSSSSHTSITTEGVDIVITLDVSTSMDAMDLQPSRVEAAKKTALKFIDDRPDDRIGLVIFASESFTQCPITLDHGVLKELFGNIKAGMVQDGTAIGNGLATAVSRLKESKAKSKVIILLTDGDNNAGEIAPETAAEIAKTFGIRVYTIGIGTRGMAPYPVKTQFGTQIINIQVEMNEELLKKIADITGGKYFRATNTPSLQKIYEEIDKLEKSKIDELIYSHKYEEFFIPSIILLVLLGTEIFLNMFVFKKIP